jgi:hypothetical protein
MKFGGGQTMKQKMDMAMARGYDTGKPSKDSTPVAKPKIKPKIRKDEIGATVKWKF